MSSTLQIGLAVAGGVVLAALVAHEAWKARKLAPRQPARSETPPADLAGAIEPQLDADPFTQEAFPLPPPEKKAGMDGLIDVIAPIALEDLVSGDAALAAMPATRRAGSKPFAVEGMNSQTRVWETPAPGQRYEAFQVGVQLANRLGALNEIEFSEFVVKAQGFCDAVNGTPDFPDMLEQVARARGQVMAVGFASVGLQTKARGASVRQACAKASGSGPSSSSGSACSCTPSCAAIAFSPG